MESKLVGYLRKSETGLTLKLGLDVEALVDAERYETKDGREYISLIANTGKVEEILDGTREVTGICYLVDKRVSP
ncbi:MAG: hypothetical protein FP824_06150 [Euryarchaeota archaeon]|nr:hypothetical protein [Euryarchaeota archaeon]MBU4032947.1 hypothetical protein [Candidatus Thermoplasmatota archaeon]MBU4144247.1 hypothetical protein [Candidatus Thermoplasmatota archaeon]